MTTTCRYCGIEIRWQKKEDGKFTPIERSTNNVHHCPKLIANRDRPLRSCILCGAQIYFDAKTRSTTGKAIPIDYETDEPHRCNGEARDRERAWREDQDIWWRKSKKD